MKSQVNIRHIEVFRAVMVAGSIVGAARLLNVTQPGVSRTVALLELRIGYPLFERRGRRLVPTTEAEALFREVEHIYTGIDRISQLATDLRFQRAGALRVATLPALAHGLVPHAVARFAKERPKVSVFVQSLPSRQIAELVATRQFDVGVVELPLARPGIRTQPLPAVETVAVVAQGHRLATRRRISLKDLEGEPMVLLSQHSYLRYRIDEAFSALGVAPHAFIETPTSSIACALVAAGAGVTLVSRWTAQPFVSSGLKLLALKEPLASSYAMIFPELAPASLLAEGFASELIALTRS